MTIKVSTMVDEKMLTGVEEAAEVGRDKSQISRRRRADPKHPVNLPDADEITVGKRVHRRAPRSAILAYWAAQPGVGRPRKTAS